MANDEQPQSQSKEEVTVDSFDKMPEVDEFKKLDDVMQRDLINKFASMESNDQEEVDSQTSDEKSKEVVDQAHNDDTSEESKEEADDHSESESEQGKDKQKQEKTKEHQELESEFTRRSQRLKKLETERDELLQRVSKLEGRVEGTSDKIEHAKSKLAQLKEKNPKAAEFIDALDEAIKEKAKELVQPVEERVTKRDAQENLDKFSSQVDSFLKSEFKEMEKELDAVISSRYKSDKELIEAAQINPNLFDELKKETIFANQDKFVEIKNKAKDNEATDPVERHKEIRKTGVSGKAKTGTAAAEDLMDINKFRKLSPDKQEALLREQGLFLQD